MGRSSGYIALQTGIGGGAETILVPEYREPMANVIKMIERGVKRGKSSSIIVVAEGAKPGLSQRISDDLLARGYKPKVCILGHTQRGGSPTAHDRLLASVLGASAVAFLLAGKSNAMVGVQSNHVALVPFRQVIGKLKELPKDVLLLAQILAS